MSLISLTRMLPTMTELERLRKKEAHLKERAIQRQLLLGSLIRKLVRMFGNEPIYYDRIIRSFVGIRTDTNAVRRKRDGAMEKVLAALENHPDGQDPLYLAIVQPATLLERVKAASRLLGVNSTAGSLIARLLDHLNPLLKAQ